ncbi:MAG: mannonate dehydratase, partial [Gammaproteobacteria bacterium]
MQETWRWFGPDDPVTLENIVQAGASGIVTALHHIPTGETWPLADVQQRNREITAHDLQWSVVESIPLHNNIKTRSGNYRELIDNYAQSIRHVGETGIEVVCYN